MQCGLQENKDYENELNHYNQNYFGLYCHCKQPHDQESIDAGKFIMLQCFQCEDWFHNTCLKPAIKVTDLPEEQILICRQCISNRGSEYRNELMANQKFFYKEIADGIEISDPNEGKRQKTELTWESTSQPTIEEFDIIISDKFLESKSERFAGIQRLIDAQNNMEPEQTKIIATLDGNIEELPDKKTNEHHQPKSEFTNSFFDQMMAKMQEKMSEQATLKTGLGGSSGMTAVGQAFMMHNIANFKAKFATMLKETSESGQIVTKEKI